MVRALSCERAREEEDAISSSVVLWIATDEGYMFSECAAITLFGKPCWKSSMRNVAEDSEAIVYLCC